MQAQQLSPAFVGKDGNTLYGRYLQHKADMEEIYAFALSLGFGAKDSQPILSGDDVVGEHHYLTKDGVSLVIEFEDERHA